MNHVADAMPLDGGIQLRQVGHVARDEVDLGQRRFVHEQPEAVRVFLEVVDKDAVAAREQVADNPAPDATVAAGQKYAHRWSSVASDQEEIERTMGGTL